jgi:hypothetical protein
LNKIGAKKCKAAAIKGLDSIFIGTFNFLAADICFLWQHRCVTHFNGSAGGIKHSFPSILTQQILTN